MHDPKRPLRDLSPGPDVAPDSTLSPIEQEMFDRAASGIRLRDDSTRILLKWMTARRLRNQELRKAA